MAKDKEDKKPKSFKQQLWKKGKKGFGKRVERFASGEGGGSSGGGGESVSAGSSFWKVVIVLGVIAAILLYPQFVSSESGFFQKAIYHYKIDVVADSIGNAFEKVGETFVGFTKSEVRKISGWESLPGSEIEIKEKTGISFSDDVRGFGNFNKFHVTGEVSARNIDPDIQFFEAVKLKCELEDEFLKGEVKVTDSKDENGTAVFKIPLITQREEGQRVKGVLFKEGDVSFDCVFRGDEKLRLKASTATGKIFKVKSILTLTYPFFVDTDLDVFIMSKEAYEQYRGRRKELFKDAGEGEYKEYAYDGVRSRMKYESDVEVKLYIRDQPLAILEDRDSLSSLDVSFKNKKPKNKIKMEEFKVYLPEGMKFLREDCEAFDVNGDEASLKKSYFEEIQDSLNDEALKESAYYSCKIYVDESALGGSGALLVPSGNPIQSRFVYEYTITEEEEINLNKPKVA